MSRLGIGERAPWGDFAPVIRNGDLGALQDEPEYQAAKAGDKQAALDLVDRLLTDDTVQRIMMNEFWQETFGYGIDKLTQGEAGHLRAAPTVDAIRDRITAARHEGIERLDAARASAPARATRGAAQAGVRAAQGGNVGEGLQETAEGLER